MGYHCSLISARHPEELAPFAIIIRDGGEAQKSFHIRGHDAPANRHLLHKKSNAIYRINMISKEAIENKFVSSLGLKITTSGFKAGKKWIFSTAASL